MYNLTMLKKLNEEIEQLLEMDIEPSFQDYINDRREEQKANDKKDMERYKANMEADPESEYWKEEYEKYLQKYMGKHEADDILKTIYNKCHINLEQGGIKEISVPANAKELKKQVVPNESAIILKRGNYISVIQGSYNEDKVILYASFGTHGSFTDSVIEGKWNGKELDLTKPNSLTQAINKGMFDKAWLVYGGSTLKTMQDRRKAFSGSNDDLRHRYPWYSDVDKSGYLKRDLKRELARLTADAKKQDFNKVKQSAQDLRKDLINKIKQSDIEDISTSSLDDIVTALKNIENTHFYSYNSDDMKNSKIKLDKNIEILKDLISKL